MIPVAAIFDDGIFKVGKDKYSKTYRFTDINYAVASREDKEAMFLEYSELLNSLDTVSYTHLDVYKRQLVILCHACEAERAGLEGNELCFVVRGVFSGKEN